VNRVAQADRQIPVSRQCFRACNDAVTVKRHGVSVRTTGVQANPDLGRGARPGLDPSVTIHEHSLKSQVDRTGRSASIAVAVQAEWRILGWRPTGKGFAKDR
jgi:hypothetical protein